MLINYPNHQLWQLKMGEEVLNFLENAFPQLLLRKIISPEEAEQFANSQGDLSPFLSLVLGYIISYHTLQMQNQVKRLHQEFSS
jgi:hypothetical protein